MGRGGHPPPRRAPPSRAGKRGRREGPEPTPARKGVFTPTFKGRPRNPLPRGTVGDPLHAKMLELVKMIVLKVRQSGLREFPAGGIVLTGGGADMTGLRELVQKTLGEIGRASCRERV